MFGHPFLHFRDAGDVTKSGNARVNICTPRQRQMYTPIEHQQDITSNQQTKQYTTIVFSAACADSARNKSSTFSALKKRTSLRITFSTRVSVCNPHFQQQLFLRYRQGGLRVKGLGFSFLFGSQGLPRSQASASRVV